MQIKDDSFNEWKNEPIEVIASGHTYYVLHETEKRMLTVYFDDWEYMFNMPVGTSRGVIRHTLMAYNQAYRQGFAAGQLTKQVELRKVLGLE